MGGFQNDGRCHARFVGFLPATRAQAPAVAVLQAGEATARGYKVVALRARKRQKRVGDAGADHMNAAIVDPGVAVPITIEARRVPRRTRM